MASNSSAMAQAAYGATSRAVRTEKGVEYQAFARATNLLTAAQAETTPGNGKMAEAVHFNRQLWSILAMDVADEDNKLPDAMRAQILGLANFVWRHSSKVLEGEQTVAALVDINATIMRGLRDEMKG